jgi:N-acetylglucosamine kinase-like BadF-type ATPase
VYVLGIDAGGSKTVCQLGDPEGRVLSEARGPGANLQSAGELDVEKVLHDLITTALEGIDATPAAICLGMAGVDRPGDARVVGGILSRLCRTSRALIVNDALIALEAGAPDQAGLVLISGTGSICYGRDDRNRAARAGGWGHILGDEGSGYWIGRQALRAVLRASDARGPRTALAPRLLEYYGVSRENELVHPVYDGGMKPKAIALLASLVGEVAEQGDEVAVRILDVGADELASSAVSVATRLGLQQSAFPLPMAGGAFHSVPSLRERVMNRLRVSLPQARVELLSREPATGAVRLASALLAGTVRVPTYIDAT